MKTKSSFPVLLILWILAGVAGAASVPIDKKVTIQPILVVGSMPAADWFEPETDKIWAQAGIDVKFLPLATYDSSIYLGIDTPVDCTCDHKNFFLGPSNLLKFFPKPAQEVRV